MPVRASVCDLSPAGDQPAGHAVLLGGDAFEVGRRLGAEVLQHLTAVPVDEVDHAEFVGLGVGARLVGGGVDAALVLFAQATVLVVGGVPYLAQALDVVVDALDRILVHQPLGDHDRLLGADRTHGEVDQVVAHAVVPRMRQVQDAHGAQVRVGDAAHEFLAAGLAVHGHGYGALEQRHAHDAVAQAEAGVGVGDVVLVPAGGAFGDLILERLAGARVGDVIPFQQGVEQFRVRTIAVVALAVVLQHQLPVGLLQHGALHRDLGVLHVVGLHVMGQTGEELVDRRRVVRQGDEDEAAGGLAVHRLEAVRLHVEVGAHLGAGEQQVALEVVSPLMIGTDQIRHLTSVFGAQARSPVTARRILPDDIYLVRALMSQWIADPEIHAVIITGGTGFHERDSTPEAVAPLLDKTIDGFGEEFRRLSASEIGTSTIQSRAIGGLANGTVIFCLPGSTGACRTGWEKVIKDQLDNRFRPCNFVAMILKHSAQGAS